MSRTRDGMALNRRSWLPIAAIAVLATFIALLGLFIWVEGNHNAVASSLSGSWKESTAGGASLDIGDDPKQEGVGYLAGDLVFSGTVDGRNVQGKIKLPTFPPWRKTARAALLGESWTLRPQDWPHALTLVSDSGRTITFTRAQP